MSDEDTVFSWLDPISLTRHSDTKCLINLSVSGHPGLCRPRLCLCPGHKLLLGEHRRLTGRLQAVSPRQQGAHVQCSVHLYRATITGFVTGQEPAAREATRSLRPRGQQRPSSPSGAVQYTCTDTNQFCPGGAWRRLRRSRRCWSGSWRHGPHSETERPAEEGH